MLWWWCIIVIRWHDAVSRSKCKDTRTQRLLNTANAVKRSEDVMEIRTDNSSSTYISMLPINKNILHIALCSPWSFVSLLSSYYYYLQSSAMFNFYQNRFLFALIYWREKPPDLIKLIKQLIKLFWKRKIIYNGESNINGIKKVIKGLKEGIVSPTKIYKNENSRL